MANTANKPARKPAAKVAAATAKAPLSERLAAALAGTAYPAASDGVAWLALLATVPAVQVEIAAARAGKYGEGKGLVPGASVMLHNSKAGAEMASTGTTIVGGKPTAKAAVCRAVANACKALKAQAVCKAAVVFFMLTDADTLALLHSCKATDGNGKATGPRYIGKGLVPCPAWAAGYVQGNLRDGQCNKVAS